jgi:phosphoglycolate phosphatase
MLKKYKHISFDLDGTLVHTLEEYRNRVVPQTVKELGGTMPDAHSIDRFWFETARDELIKTQFNLDPDKFWKTFNEIDLAENRAAHTQAYEDSAPALRKLKEMGKTVSIITGCPHKIGEMEITKLNGAPFDIYFSIFDNGYLQKPDPKSFHYVLGQLKIKPQDTVYIGNSNEDAYYAKNAGADFIYLERRKHDFDLKDVSIATIHTLDELII